MILTDRLRSESVDTVGDGRRLYIPKLGRECRIRVLLKLGTNGFDYIELNFPFKILEYILIVTLQKYRTYADKP